MVQKNEVTFISLLHKIVKNWRLIFVNFLIVTVVAVVISLFLPKWYKAECVIMPPMKETTFGIGMGLAGDLAGMMLGGGGDFDLPMFATPSDIYEMILKSKSVADTLIKNYDLISLYDLETIEETREELAAHTFIEVGKEGAIFVGFEAKEDPELAAQVATAYIEELDRTNQRVKVYYAKNTREFVEGQLTRAMDKLRASEDSLRAFQERYNTLDIEEQVKSAVEVAGQLMGMKQYYELQLSELITTLNPNHAEVRQMKNKLNAVNKKIRDMKYGNHSDVVNYVMGETDLFPPFVKVPELGMEYARLLRDFKIQEMIFELLTQQHEQEKIKEVRNTPTVVVLDKAIPPTKKSRPKRAIIVALSALLSIFYSIFVIFVKEYLEDLRTGNPDEYEKYESIRAELKGIFRKRRDRV